MNSDRKDFVIDVAKERKFTHQSEEYSREFSKWRSKENNPYAYKFIHDTREHSYVADEGYLNRKADVAERMALYKCLGLLGVVLLVMVGIDVFHAILQHLLYPESKGSYIYFSENTIGETDLSFAHAVLFSVMDMIKYLLPAFIFKLVTKIPAKVVVPKTKNSSKVIFSSVLIMLVVMMLGRICNYAVAKVLEIFHLESVYIYMIPTTNRKLAILSVLMYCIILPICVEVFLRGVVLQTFRQFGDGFALFISSIISGFMFYDISNIGYGICCAVVVGFFTLKTGSLSTAILMKVAAASFNYVLTILSLFDTTLGPIIEISICALFFGCAIIVYSRLTASGEWSFNVPRDNSEMSFSKKLRVMLSTNTIAIWLAASLVFTFLCTKVI